jgi:hypothetical protein
MEHLAVSRGHLEPLTAATYSPGLKTPETQGRVTLREQILTRNTLASAEAPKVLTDGALALS